VIDFMGQPIEELPAEERVATTTISATQLAAHRERFPAMLDADRFSLD
jgi:predicted amidohydrolase